ncbi:hypothetical protein [Sporosarcina sp. YIM B06819]|uniref:hypothetical protein n=1 Tax=Sporosarcina sp. YIM B06819 TaxID=3081769 RepID=UPI00298C1D69|nr:hypothetical protein [Sporosarcina sp. YIM B06819]
MVRTKAQGACSDARSLDKKSMSASNWIKKELHETPYRRYMQLFFCQPLMEFRVIYLNSAENRPLNPDKASGGCHGFLGELKKAV